MMLALVVTLVGSAAPPSPVPLARLSDDDPPIKVWLNHDTFYRGDNARVNVKTAEDGYVVVLRVDAEGRVRVLFPLDPSSDDFVRGGETIEVRGRGDREAFFVDEREGEGVVVAARSATPFKFDEFVRGDHWDYRVLDARQAGDDKESALVDIVQRMTPDGHFDYDAARYIVETYRTYSHRYVSPGWDWDYGGGWGWPYRYTGFGSCYDPLFYDPFACGFYPSSYYWGYYNPYYYGYSPFWPYGYGGFGFTYVYRPYFQPYIYTQPFLYGNQPNNLFVNRLRGGPGTGSGLYFKDRPGTNLGLAGIGARWRGPPTTLYSGVQSRGVRVRERAWSSADPVRTDPFDVRRGSDRPTRVERPVDRGSGGDREAPGRVRDSGGRDRGFSEPAARE
ncbi:MAG TPA: DUF4384 domain-containing protein, partial [Gemmatimonadales bacterium]|nr:DUF4384 domain-containing protein [Gemmatimonadales bacterium]